MACRKRDECPLCPGCGAPLRHCWAYTTGDWYECHSPRCELRGMVRWVCIGCGHPNPDQNGHVPRVCSGCGTLFWTETEPDPPVEMRRRRRLADINWPDTR